MSLKDRYDSVETKVDDVLERVRLSNYSTVIVGLVTLAILALIVLF